VTGKQLKADAILWDFDGTLADTAAKNMVITKQILAHVAPQLTGANLPSWLQNKADYHKANHGAENWRELYSRYFGMSTEDIQAAGPMWEQYQAQDNTEVTLFDGILETLGDLASIPMGISSANSSANIIRVLRKYGITTSFQSVIGYETFTHATQKPAADPGLKCLQEVLQDCRGKTIIYIGDHIADVIFSRNIANSLGPSSTVVSVIVTYSGAQPDSWRVQPDEVIENPMQLTTLFGS